MGHGSVSPGNPVSEATRVGVASALGVASAAVCAALLPWQTVPLGFWIVTALAWMMPVWATVLAFDAEGAERYATREDPRGAAATGLILMASLSALVAVILGIVKASGSHGWERPTLLGAGIGAIICSWGVVNTVFTLRYAGAYYRSGGGVDFNSDEPPDYADFAYLAFTVGMTYQVSDTDLRTRTMRRMAVRHALLSYLLGTIIIAATINLAAGLVK